jgi:ABC-2 type transport system permease protein
MLYLIKKELTANVRYMLFGLVAFVVYVFIFAYTDAALFTMCLIISFYAVSTTNLILDERYKIDLLLTTLPIRRKDVILSKYLLVLVDYIFSFLLYTLLAVLSRAAGFDKVPMLTLFSAALGFVTICIFNGLTLPLSYKFGAQATRWVSFILFFGIFFLGSILGKLTQPGAAASLTALGDAQLSLLLFAAGLLVSAASYFITAAVYEKKDL